MRSLVTGGAGFIGSHLVDALVSRGAEVIALDDLSTGRPENLTAALSGGAELAEADIRDGGALEAVFRAARPEVVFHLAARTQVRRSLETPAEDARVNVEGTINALEAARRSGARRFVFASTGGAIYGDARVLPTREEEPPRPRSPYGQSKLAAEGYAELYRRLHGLSTVALRYGNVYGPRQDPFGEAGVVAIFAGRLLARGRPTVYGDGLQTRDYVYVEDVAAANLAAAANDVEGAINVGRGEQTSVLDLVRVFASLGDASFEPEHADGRPGEVRFSALDPSRARSELGWEATVAVREGLARTLAWAREAAAPPR